MPAERMQNVGSCSYGSTPPTDALPGDTWLDTSDCTIYTYINDGTSSQWVDLNGSSYTTSTAGVVTYISDTQPSDQAQYLWIQTGLGDDGTDVTFWINI